MLGPFAATVVFIAWVCLTVIAFLLINFLWPADQRTGHNEIVGWQLSVIGTTYAVILGFMLFNVWDNFRTADLNADQEANALVNLYRLSEGLPDPTKASIQRDAREYAQIMIQEEWPDMAHRTLSAAGTAVTQELWETVVTAGKDPAVQGPDFTQALSELSTMTQHRRVRHLESQFRLPGLLWTVLLAGGLITLISSCLLSAENLRLHFVLVICMSLVLGITLLAIAEVDQPFRGAVRVQPHGFRLALETFDRLSHADQQQESPQH
ncbi:MAG: hypothetical protein WCA15_15680 [Candidatus Acidiferrales bacterium]